MNWQSKYIGFGVLILLGLILAFAPVDRAIHQTVPAEKLIKELQKSDYYISADELAHWIIDKQPGFIVVDIRSDQDFINYHIPGALHIPLANLLDPDNLETLSDAEMVVLASNGNTRAGQAWLLLKQKGMDNVFILQGGLNYWVNIFTNPKKPEGVYTDDELFAYHFHKAAGPVLMGNKAALQNETQQDSPKPKPKPRIRKKKAAKVDEGC